MIEVYNFLSLLVFALCSYPVIQYIITTNIYYLYIVVFIILIECFIKTTRFILPQTSLFLRPKKAFNCGICNGGGDYSNRIGMPSGHVMMSTFIIFVMVSHLGFIQQLIGLFLVCCIAFSRVRKNCHNIAQVTCGFIFGIIFGMIFVSLFQKDKNNMI